MHAFPFVLSMSNKKPLSLKQISVDGSRIGCQRVEKSTPLALEQYAGLYGNAGTWHVLTTK
jgi:hypothetical protein